MLKSILTSLLILNLILQYTECRNRVTVYPNIGQSVSLQCINGGQFVCFSTYTFQNITYPMIMLNNSMKYSLTMGGVTINNVEATDAGYYACSSNCNQLRSDGVDYYLHPISNQLPIDVTAIFLAIPPFAGYSEMGGINAIADSESFQYPMYPANYFKNNNQLNGGAIAGIVIACISFLVILVAIILFASIWLRRRKNNNQGKPNKNNRAPVVTGQDSSAERDYALKSDTIKSDKQLIQNDEKNQLFNNHQRGGLDSQARLNYELADRIANQFAYENQQQQQPQQRPPLIPANPAQPKSFGGFGNLDSTPSQPQQPKPQNQYGSIGQQQQQQPPNRPPQPGYELPAKLPSNRQGPPTLDQQPPQQPEPQQKTPIRNRVEFPKPQLSQQQQLPQVLPQLVRGPSGGSNRQRPEDIEQSPPLLDPHYDVSEDDAQNQEQAFRGKTGFSNTRNIDNYNDGTEEERRQLAQQDPSESVSFKSLIRAQKQQSQEQQPLAPTNRSYQGAVQQQLPQQYQAAVRPQQLPPRQPPPPAVYTAGRGADSLQLDTGAPVKDNATDV